MSCFEPNCFLASDNYLGSKKGNSECVKQIIILSFDLEKYQGEGGAMNLHAAGKQKAHHTKGA